MRFPSRFPTSTDALTWSLSAQSPLDSRRTTRRFRFRRESCFRRETHSVRRVSRGFRFGNRCFFFVSPFRFGILRPRFGDRRFRFGSLFFRLVSLCFRRSF